MRENGRWRLKLGPKHFMILSQKFARKWNDGFLISSVRAMGARIQILFSWMSCIHICFSCCIRQSISMSHYKCMNEKSWHFSHFYCVFSILWAWKKHRLTPNKLHQVNNQLYKFCSWIVWIAGNGLEFFSLVKSIKSLNNKYLHRQKFFHSSISESVRCTSSIELVRFAKIYYNAFWLLLAMVASRP